jgi:hypothetical protein
MATRAEVTTVIDTQNPDNTTALITPLATRTSQKAINDNSFNLSSDNTDNITEGATNKYYADSLVNTFLTDGSVSSVVFGTDTSLTWNATDFTLDMPLDGVTIQLGQETVARVLNKTGTAMTNGQVVIVSGAQGNRLTVDLADNTTDLTSGAILGIITEPIANNQQGFATITGLVRGLNTNSFNEGDVLYLGSSGAITNVKPVTPLHLVTVGYCVRSDSTQGSIFSHPQNGYELDELHDVLITSAQNNDVLSWNSAGSYWENVALPSAPVDSVNSQTGVVVLDADNIAPTAARIYLNGGNQTIVGDKLFTGATVAGSLAAYRPVGSEINANADLTQITGNTFYNVNASGGAITIDVDDTSNTLFPIGSEFEFSPIDLTNDVNFAALGAQTINSVDGHLKLDKPFSGSILKKTAVNTWLLIGTLKA